MDKYTLETVIEILQKMLNENPIPTENIKTFLECVRNIEKSDVTFKSALDNDENIKKINYYLNGNPIESPEDFELRKFLNSPITNKMFDYLKPAPKHKDFQDFDRLNRMNEKIRISNKCKHPIVDISVILMMQKKLFQNTKLS